MAVFDVDGTLIKDNIGITFVKYLHERRAIRPFPKLIVAVIFVLYKLRLLGFEHAIKAGAWALVGVDEAIIAAHAHQCFDERIKYAVFPDALEEIEACRSNGYRIIIATGAHSSIAERLANFVNADICVATNSELSNGKYGFGIHQPIPFREGKRDAVLAGATNRYGSPKFRVYTDEKKDIPLLSIAEELFGVNADVETTRFVKDRGGTLLNFSSRPR